MNRLQRVVLIVYFLLLGRCLLFVPWRAEFVGADQRIHSTPAINAWLWDGDRASIKSMDLSTTPDLPLIALRSCGYTALAFAVFFTVGPWKTKH
jgi:hypothetical protein